MASYSYGGWRPYVPVAARRRQAAQKIAKMKKAGREIAPIEIAGRKIATTFWGDAWCKNLEAYSDYANRLPRGRTYVRNGSVIDLQIETGRVRALVSGSEIYRVDIEIAPLAKQRWTDIKGRCGGQIDSLIELLRGSVSKAVMEIVTRKDEGLFPSPPEISLSCSCPDWATMCKHVAATLYGAGARLDHEPELLFTLRGVDPAEMVETAVDQPPIASKRPRARVLESDRLSSVFGIDIDEASSEAVSTPAKPTKRARGAARDRDKATSREKKVQRKSTARKSAKKAAAGKTASRKATAKKAGTRKTATKKKTAAKKAVTKKTHKKPASKRKAASKQKTSTVRPAAKKAGNRARGGRRPAARVHAGRTSART